MTQLNTRTTVTVAVTMFVALGLLASPAAAAGGDGLLGGAPTDSPVETDGGGIEIDLGGGTSQGGGSGSVDCEAGSSGAHECQKEGTLEGGPVTIEYEGNNSADPANQEGAFDDSLTVEANNESLGGSIECELSANTSGNPCDYNYTAPGGGGAPTLPPEDPGLPIEPPTDPGLPIEPPTDPGLPSPPESPGLPVPPEAPELPGPGLPASVLA